jgi:hypothetical protein
MQPTTLLLRGKVRKFPLLTTGIFGWFSGGQDQALTAHHYNRRKKKLFSKFLAHCDFGRCAQGLMLQ